MNNLYYLTILIFFGLQSRMLSDSSYKIINVPATEGENVTLPVWDRGTQEFVEVVWKRADSNHFATTKPRGFVDIREDVYKGRLYGSDNGSLTITNITAKDQGLYRATIYLSHGDPNITDYYLNISAKAPDGNLPTQEVSAPVSSSTIPNITPVPPMDSEKKMTGGTRTHWIIGLVVVVLVIIAVLYFICKRSTDTSLGIWDFKRNVREIAALLGNRG